jgi:release factor glutamine methyltransferase
MFQDFLKRRAQGEPAAYIIGKKGFYKWDFKVLPGVLIPRPETEHVIELVKELYKTPPTQIADLGCGSGILGICLAKELKCRVTAIDSSPIAVGLTQQNAHLLKVSNKMNIVCSSVADYLPGQTFELIVSNPPYIANGDTSVEANVQKFEPHQALYAGPRGTEKIQEWSRWALKFLDKGGWWVFEFGSGQKQQIEEIILAVGFINAKFAKDLAGIDRVCAAQKP